MKRDHSNDSVDPPTKISRVSIAQEALRIVLQHGMIVDLGWSVEYFESWILRLREEIIKDRIKEIPHDAVVATQTELMFHLEMELAYYDQAYADRNIAELTHITPEAVVFQVNTLLVLHCWLY